MKALVCELCGSNEFVKEDGYFVCQHCHTKYSLEEAKKIMVEGTVDVSGSTVKVDDSRELENLYQVARRARKSGNIQQAAKYYDMILAKDPLSWEADLYSVYYSAFSSTKGEVANSITQVANTVKTCFPLIKESLTDSDKLYNTLFDISDDLCKLSEIVFIALVDLEGTKHEHDVGGGKNFVENIIPSCKVISEQPVIVLSDLISENYPESPELIELSKALKSKYATGNHNFNLIGVVYDQMSGGLGKYLGQAGIQKGLDDIRGVMQEKNDSSADSTLKKQGGCYVATAVYGSYDCPEVWTLRRFRDYTLAETWYGRAFIHTYYAISPTLVKRFGKTVWFKKLWKPMLDSMVRDLQSKGVENTPYEDRKW